MRLQIGNTIKTLRKRDGRTQEDVAQALGITFQRFLVGNRKWLIPTLIDSVYCQLFWSYHR